MEAGKEADGSQKGSRWKPERNEGRPMFNRDPIFHRGPIGVPFGTHLGPFGLPFGPFGVPLFDPIGGAHLEPIWGSGEPWNSTGQSVCGDASIQWRSLKSNEANHQHLKFHTVRTQKSREQKTINGAFYQQWFASLHHHADQQIPRFL